MDAALPNPFENHRLIQGSGVRSASMEKPLTETEFAKAVADSLPRLVAIARRLAGNEEFAEDAVQAALLKASKSWRRFRGQSHVETWMTRIVIHAVRDTIAAERRRKRRDTPYPELDAAPPSIPDDKSGPSESALNHELHEVIRSAVQLLPDRQREVFALATWHGMNAREIAELLEIKTQTVHANLHAARSRLKDLLNHYVNGDQESHR